jgi:putative DNA primase/helicase
MDWVKETRLKLAEKKSQGVPFSDSLGRDKDTIVEFNDKTSQGMDRPAGSEPVPQPDQESVQPSTVISKQEKTEQHFRLVFNEAQGIVNIFTLQDAHNEFFLYPEQLEQMVAYCGKRAKHYEVFYGIGLRRKRLPSFQRGTAKDVSVITAFGMDIDILDGSAHVSVKLPKTKAEALEFLASLPCPPSFIVDSGHGVHAYWLLDQAIDVDKVGLDKVKRMMRALTDAVNALAAKRGWEFDPVTEPSHMLRAPGTINHKNGQQVEVGFPVGDGRRYTIEELEAACVVMQYLASPDAFVEFDENHDGRRPAFQLPEVVEEGHRNMTLFRFACSLRAKGQELETILITAQQVNDSICSPPLSDPEVESIVRSACRYPAGPTKPRSGTPVTKQPVILPATPDVDMMDIRELLSNPVLDTILFAPDPVERQLRLEACRVRARKLGVVRGFNELWKARLTMHLAASAHARKTGGSTMEIDLPGIPLLGLVAGEWTVDAQGVRRLRSMSGIPVPEEACPHPILLVERLVNVDTHVEKVRIAWVRSGTVWEDTVVSRSVIASRQSIVALSDFGVMVTSENAKYQVQYLHEFESLNYDVIPRRRSVSRFGWIGHLEFSPYAPDIAFDGDPRMRNLFLAVGAQGDADKWLACARNARSSPIIRAIMAASFAAPLVWLLGKQVFFVHLWGMTGTGKTVAMLLAASIWGDPRILTRTFNSTGVGLERMAALQHSLPLFLDEFQTMDKRRLDMNQLMYQLAEGVSKGRGTKLGGIEPEMHWANVILTNGEESLTTSSSGGGAKNRVIEISIDRPVFADAPGVAQVVASNFGYAGKAYIDGLTGVMADGDAGPIREVYNHYRECVGHHPGHTDKQLTTLAILCTAEYFACRFVFEMSTSEADRCARELNLCLQPKLTDAQDVDQTNRAWEWVEGWLAANRSHFDNSVGTASVDRPVYGVIDGASWFVIGSVLDDALTQAGYSARKCAHEFALRGWTFRRNVEADGTPRNKVRKSISGTPVWCYELHPGEKR